MNGWSRGIAVFFLLTCSFWILPAELVHEWTGHEDAHDVACNTTNATQVGVEHHHCVVLELSVPPLLPCAPATGFRLPVILTGKPVLQAPDVFPEAVEAGLFFRGPPTA